MAKKTLKRQLKESNDRANTRLKYHLEMLGSAFAQVSNLDPRETALQVDTEKDEVTKSVKVKYYYVPYKPSKEVNLDNTHPDIEYLFHLAYGIVNAKRRNDVESVEDGFNMIEKFMERYAEALGDKDDAQG